MDTGRGVFEPLTEEIERDLRKAIRDTELKEGKQSDPVMLPRVFCVGQEVEVNGSHFRVVKIAKRRLVLKLLADK